MQAKQASEPIKIIETYLLSRHLPQTPLWSLLTEVPWEHQSLASRPRRSDRLSCGAINAIVSSLPTVWTESWQQLRAVFF